MISIIVACNHFEILEKYLAASLKTQSFKDYELIVVDTKRQMFFSAAKALNYGASLAKGNLLVFAHQDICLLERDALQELWDCAWNNDFGLAGVAGAIGKNKFEVASSVIMGDKRIQAGIPNKSICRCYALDECLMITKKESFKGFDDLGETWHFYGVEYSYRCLLKQEKVLLFPIDVYHASAAKSLDKNYFDTLKLFAKKYPKEKLIRTCCGYFKNNGLLDSYCLYRKFKLFLKGKINGNKT